MADAYNSGSQLVTADAAIGTSGTPVRVFSISFLSGGTAGVVVLRNGTSASATAYITENGVISQGKTIEYGVNGTFFPAGCFCDIDANVTSCLVNYSA